MIDSRALHGYQNPFWSNPHSWYSTFSGSTNYRFCSAAVFTLKKNQLISRPRAAQTLVFQGSVIYTYICMNIYICCCYVAKSCPALCNSVNCSMLGFPVLHYLPEFAQVRVCWVADAIQPSHPLPSPSRPVLNLSQHQGLFQWVGPLHQVAHVHCSSICGMYIYFCSFEDLKLKTSKTVLLTSYLCDYMKMK